MCLPLSLSDYFDVEEHLSRVFCPQRQCEGDPGDGLGGAGPQGHLLGGLLDLPKLHLQLPWQ